MQKQIEVKTEQGINLSQKIIMPTHRELLKSKQYNLPIISLSPFAVFVKKMASTQRHSWTGNINVDKQAIQDICKDFSSYDFLINFQFKKQTDFNQSEMDYLEQVQQIPELSYICMNEKSVNQTAQEFEQQLKVWKLRNAGKFIVPVIESSTNEKVKKIAVMKREGIKRCAVIFRSFITEDDRADLSRILANVRVAKIYSMVFGVNPKKNGLRLRLQCIFHRYNLKQTQYHLGLRGAEQKPHWSFYVLIGFIDCLILLTLVLRVTMVLVERIFLLVTQA